MDLGNFVRRCDVCGEKYSEAVNVQLHEQYRVDGIVDVCQSCYDQIREVWFKLNEITGGLRNTFLQRWIRRLKASFR